MGKLGTMQKTYAEKLLRNAFWNGVPNVFRLMIGIVLVPFVLSKVDTDLYGIWRLSFSLLASSWILQLGLNSTINREVPRGIVHKNYTWINEVVSTAYYFYMLLSVVLVFFTVFLIYKFPVWFKVQPENTSASRMIIGLTGLGYIVWMPFAVYRAVLNGLQEFKIIGLTEIVSSLIYAGLVYMILSSGLGAVALTVVSIIRILFPTYLLAYFAKRQHSQLRVSIRHAHFSVFRSVFSYGFNSGIYSVATAFFTQGSIWVTGALLGSRQTAYYSTCIQLTALVGGILSLALVVTKPAASELEAKNDTERLEQLLLESSKYIVLFSLPVTVFLCIYRAEIIQLWIRKAEFSVIIPLIPWLAVMQVAWLTLQANYYVMNGIGKHRIFALLAVGTTILGLSCSVLCVKSFHLGLFGVALGMSLPIYLVGFLILPLYSCLVLRIRVLRYVRTVWLRSIAPGILLYGSLFMLHRFLAPSTLIQLVISAMTCVFLAAILFYCFALDSYERKRFHQLIKATLLCSKSKG